MKRIHKISNIPARDWRDCPDKDTYGFTAEVADAATQALDRLVTTSFIAIAGGDVLYDYGDVSQVSYCASVRKSILSMLYGIYVERGVIDLHATMTDLGIDENEGLLDIEKTATLRDLITSSSGVYHPAGSPGGDTKGIPERGSKVPGKHFFYNNWDFNVLGAAFEKLTGKSVFKAFEEHLAGPLGLQDFDINRQRMLGYPDASRYYAYHMFLSARDLARIGHLMTRGGRWDDQQLIPPNWVTESTSMFTAARDMDNRMERIAGYSYLWWLPDVPAGKPWWRGSFFAVGNFGQYALCLPALDMTFVHRHAITDEQAIGRNQGTFHGELATVTMQEFLAVCDIFTDEVGPMVWSR
ncbi:serine hydrolase domain-containing protein [Sagittula stellata]|uniref:Beta-lactamase-related domain-containing protein n=1 Tax=Sagittula stellata (strain ATCC 700073 / DSM 11524 / E-37) TaxID=388399 RepID=A3JXL1_SAGS3|nr:serine hydrolase [Sagittula stellata]EBA10247.1 hypothetical protein SSE37_19617 [Sagittula stellata E-37]